LGFDQRSEAVGDCDVWVRTVSDVPRHRMERVTGIEPAFSAWEGGKYRCRHVPERIETWCDLVKYKPTDALRLMAASSV
jgi:hypothetical protein